jgi:hypothetical protein
MKKVDQGAGRQKMWIRSKVDQREEREQDASKRKGVSEGLTNF